MEISLLKSLLNNITSFLQLAPSEGIKCEPAEKYHKKIEEILKLLKPILDAIVGAEIASDEMLQKAFAGLHHYVGELREIFEKWEPLMSKIYFVLQVESLLTKIETYCLEIPKLLKSSDQFLSADLSVTFLEHCVEKVKHIGCEQKSSIIMKAINDHVDGSGAGSETVEILADSLGLKSKFEVLVETVALEKLKETTKHAGKHGEIEHIDHMISLVTNMHDHIVKVKLHQTRNSVQIPAYFICPLSHELMVDPVIIESGQTYERVFIEKWIDLGLTVCPVTRQTLLHISLTPNHIVKGLITQWHEANNKKLPDPTKDNGAKGNKYSTPPDPTEILSFPCRISISSTGIPLQVSSTSHRRPLLKDSSLGASINENNMLDSGTTSMRSSEVGSDYSGEISLSDGYILPLPSLKNSDSGIHEQSSYDHNLTNLAVFQLSKSDTSGATPGDGSEASSQAAAYRSDSSGELMSEPQLAVNLGAPPSESKLGYHSQSVGPNTLERFVRRVVPAVEPQGNVLEVETQVRKLVEDLQNTSLDAHRNATAELRLLAKHDANNRILIADCGGISLLVNLLRSTDPKVQENAATALLNLSLDVKNKTAIVNADAIEPLIHVLETGNIEAKQNSAATFFSLSEIEENKIKIGRSGAIGHLVDLLGNGTPGAKKDALKALFRLSKFQQNQILIVKAGAVKYLIELIDPTTGMVDQAVALLSNLANSYEGRSRIGRDGGIPALVEIIELGSARTKENAVAALLQLCTKSGRNCNMAFSQGAVPPLVALSQSGTTRAKEKAQALLTYFKNQRRSH